MIYNNKDLMTTENSIIKNQLHVLHVGSEAKNVHFAFVVS